uniref:Uncharacterized protein n=1 Tax=Conchiformibius kuhniae TaxID=211502 RepID=A0A8T9MVQ1_9NEIS|nr:hypothetical protein LVJ77_02915 [Conchiformibius kuhniae]
MLNQRLANTATPKYCFTPLAMAWATLRRNSLAVEQGFVLRVGQKGGFD